MEISKRAITAFSVCVLAGAVAVGSAVRADTDWDALSGADWGSTGDAGAAAGADAGAGGEWTAAIERAFVDLGMAAPRAECYGKVLAEELSPAVQQEAVQLVSDAATADEVKVGVISGGPEMVGGFSAASVSCPKSMGG